jgi:hypothetical protein
MGERAAGLRLPFLFWPIVRALERWSHHIEGEEIDG